MAAASRERALVLHRKGDLAGAASAYRALLAEQPDDAALWEYLAVASASAEGGAVEAGDAFRRSLALLPANGSAYFNLGALRVRLSQDGPALVCFRRATAAAAKNAEAWMQRANTAIRLGRNSEAMAAHRAATRIVPLEARYWEQRATLLRRAKRREEADGITRQALVLLPAAANLWAARSAVFFETDEIAAALTAGKRAAVSDPANADGQANYAQALYRQGRVEDAIARAGTALARAPDNPVLLYNLGLYCLTAGRLATGWRLYDARLIPSAELRRGLPPARWTPGGHGRHLIVPAEQGLGDEVLFASCFSKLDRLLEDDALASVTAEATDRLLPLMRRSFPRFRFFERIRKQESRLEPADYSAIVRETGADCTIMAGSLPGIFWPTLDAMGENASYLLPDPDRVAHWRRKLAEHGPGPFLGLSWRSRAGRDLEAVYYPGAGNLAPFLSIPGLRFVTLQYDEDEAELQAIERENGIEIIRPEGLDLTNDLDGVAALIAAVDAVVSPQNLVLSLTGAQGKPGYTMPHCLNWLSFGTDRLPISPTLRLDMRREEEGLNWGPVMTRLAARLKADLGL